MSDIMLQEKSRWALSVCLLVLVLTILQYGTIFVQNSFSQPTSTELQIIFIDVRQGDSTLIILPNGGSMLIDGGEREQGATVLSTLSEYGLDEIDVLIATHPHADHIGGLISVLQNIPVNQVIDSGQETNTRTFEDYLEVIDAKQIPFSIAKDGESINLDENVSVEILNPPEPLLSGTGDDLNNNSVVIKLVYGNFSIIFPGDIGEVVEERLLGEDLDSDMLLAPHHGSKYSNSLGFLNAVSPNAVVIYAGENNPYNHPHLETLGRLHTIGVPHILRTDLNGTLILETSGNQNFNVTTTDASNTLSIPS